MTIKEKFQMIFTTITCANHIPLSLVLGKSLKLHHPNSKVVLCLVEETIPPGIQDSPYFDEVLLAKDLGIPDFYKLVFKYNKYESSCAIKAFLFKHLIDAYQNEVKFTYLDSDIKIYSPLNELQQLLDQHSIVITPHRLAPQDYLNASWEEVVNLKDGVFNGGLIGLRRERETLEFLKWWANRLQYYCYIDSNTGLFLDQKWLNLIPCFFDNYKVLRHDGYNFASWNLSQRYIIKTVDGQYWANNSPLRFIHFSGLGKWFDEKLNHYVKDLSNPLYFLKDDYIEEINREGFQTFKDIPWCYDYFNDGKYIFPQTKTRYRNSTDLQELIPHPFQTSNEFILKFKKKRFKPLVSVITSVYNGQEFINDAINSIQSQTYKNFEFIIVNDGSTDNTIELLKNITDSRVKVINLEKNRGAAYCLDLGIKQANGQWIAIQDADDISLSTRLEEQVKHVECYQDVIAVGSLVKCISNSVREDVLDGVEKYWNLLVSIEQMYKKRFFQTPFCHGTAFFSKKAYLQVGGYNPNYRITYDWDLWMRLFQAGPIHKIKKVLYHYRVDKESLSLQKWNYTYYEIIKLAMNYIDDIYSKNGIHPILLVLGTDRKCQNFKDALHYNKDHHTVHFEDYSNLSQWEKELDEGKVNGIIVLDDQNVDELVQEFEKRGMELNQNLFVLHNGIHGLIEIGAI